MIILIISTTITLYLILALLGWYIGYKQAWEKDTGDEEELKSSAASSTLLNIGLVLRYSPHFAVRCLLHPFGLSSWWMRRDSIGSWYRYVKKQPHIIPPEPQDLADFIVDQLPEIPETLRPLLRADADRLRKKLIYLREKRIRKETSKTPTLPPVSIDTPPQANSQE